ncbi:rhomboid family intramembrane serine protease [Aureisphaera galaxeae]|uniref:rhomboid family intramembrane serine protease n=1 Tax=Aureisphaera galaxeae TaxID=1538023 RepID=UPI0023504724|nr:rhomboid family intramembrane serine protease [Aureisphaera galaxeae]MDC8005594.1 rhomboid family intramembrane serine protease [Aureisphaera galaxeae]
MKEKTALRFSTDVVLYPLLFIFSIWMVYWIEVRFDVSFNRWGVYPQTLKGLRGVLFAPFIHSGLSHIFNNSIPLFVLSMGLFYFYRGIRWKVLLVGFVATGLLTWIIARPALHIGASGIVYMLAAFLFFKGIASRRLPLIALSLIVVFLYGSMVWYLFPVDPKISWEGHLSGFLVGIALALFFKGHHPVENKKYEWEKEDYNEEDDVFLQHFDEDGNFIENRLELMKEEAEAKARPKRIIRIKYFYKEANKEEE